MTSAVERSDRKRASHAKHVTDKAEPVEAKRSRFFKVALWVFCVTALVTAGLGVTRTSLFAVQPQVTGLVHLGHDEVLAAAGITPSSRYFDLNDEALRRGVTSLAWVEDVTVTTSMPHTVRIEVAERVPAGLAPCPTGGAGCRVVIDRTGRVLGEAGGQYSVPMLEQLVAVPATGGWLGGTDHDIAITAGMLPAKLRPNVISVGRDGPDLVLRVKPGPAKAKKTAKKTPAEHAQKVEASVVRIGSKDGLSEKLAAAAAVLETGGGPDVAEVDVRIAGYPVLTRTNAPSSVSTSRKG